MACPWRPSRGWWSPAPYLLSSLIAVSAASVSAQTTTMPSTLRYGSGLIDIPVASVLSEQMVTATVSGFFMDLDRRVLVDDGGGEAGFGPGVDEFFTDASVAIGFAERFEAGVSLQAFADRGEGGNVWGAFGRIRLWEPVDQGVGVALGARYLTSPTFRDGRAYRPGRLGFPDERLRQQYQGREGADTNLSLYAVATAFLRGFDGGPLPPNDMTFTLGYGSGMFGGPGELDFYSQGNANGWFVGSSIHFDVSERSMLTVMAEHNGFDVNVGLHYDWEGFRIGAQYLATNHDWPSEGHYSEYQRPKVGVLGSVSVCFLSGSLRCRPRQMRRVEPDTIFIPPPPPDTVVVTVSGAPSDPGGVESSLCLSTGRNIAIRLTAEGDTLVGPSWVSLREAGPNLELSGSYAESSFWYRAGQRIVFEGNEYGPSDETFPIDCEQILRVGVYEGVPVFAVLAARRPLSIIFVPVRPGLWRRYERGL